MHKQVYGARGRKPLRTSPHAAGRRDRSTFKLPTQERSEWVLDYFASIDTPVSLSCAILYSAGEWKQLVEKDIRPIDFESIEDFRGAFAAISFLRKFPCFDTGIDTEKVALDTFKTCEESCKVINRSFRTDSWVKNPHDPWLLNATQRKISAILGSKNRNDQSQGFDIDQVLHFCGWGPGSTLTVKGKDTSASIKFQKDRDITRNMYASFGSILNHAFPGWIPVRSEESKAIVGNSIITVPKNAKTDRTIAIEPGINSFVQLGVGKLIRKRLRSAGYDLNSDQKNRAGALKGSRTGHLATVDFSSASDTISKEVVETLLPPVWFSVLDDIRSHYYTLSGEEPRYFEKFSTMGCGFTFELESLIFLSAALAVCEYLGVETHDVAVFGDDIIIPSDAFDTYRAFCATLGFTVNTRKSYFSGVFRESCGSYFFKGVDVKPLFLKKEVSTFNEVISFANAIRTLSHRWNNFQGCDVRFLSLWQRCARIVGRSFIGPAHAGDLCLSVNFDEACPRKARNGIEGFYYTAWVPRAVEVLHDSEGHLLARLSSCGKGTSNSVSERVVSQPCLLRLIALDFKTLPQETSGRNLVSLRRVVKYSRRDRLIASQWYNFGGWY